MPRFVPRLALALLAVVAGASVLPGSAAPAEGGNFIAVNTRGQAKNVSDNPNRTVFELDMFSLATGEKIGTARDDVFCSTQTPPPCQVFDAITTFRFPDGDLTTHAQVSVVPDPQRPGWFQVHARSEGNGVEGGTGRYAGRTGKVRLNGINEGSNYPNELTIDDLWVIELDPK